jgi:L-fuculokinase
MPELLVGIDVGATGIKAGLFDPQGRLVARATRRNAPRPQISPSLSDPLLPPGEGLGEGSAWLIWDGDEVWSQVCDALREVTAAAPAGSALRGVAVTGFGADGTPMGADGRQLYPFISWHCARTVPQVAEVAAAIDPYEAYRVTGYHNYPFNTINRLLWLREHAPGVLDRAHRWLMMQDFIAHRLSGSFSTEVTIASTTMLLDLARRDWSPRMLEVAGVPASLFPPLSEAGAAVGQVTRQAAEVTGLPVGLPVATGGHDCEIGMLGSGVGEPSTFVDITGTWEMLIAMQDRFSPGREAFEKGIDTEAHAIPGKYLCQGLMPAGSVVEWVREQFYPGQSQDDAYDVMVAEAAAEPPGAGAVFVLPAFVRGSGPFAADSALGALVGLTTQTRRAQVVRAAFESLCFQMRRQLEVIERSSSGERSVVSGEEQPSDHHSPLTTRHSPRCERLRVLGGGQRNNLWLQMKADVTGRPVEVLQHPEVTLMGVALLAGVGAGVYRDVQEAVASIEVPVSRLEPDAEAHRRYQDAYARFLELAPALRSFYVQGGS